ncbi:MAG: UDP-N-acetylmuramoyl-tripeptide--D-alanyl-D-alanine ligase [Propionibacteriaceae bacterium]|jgi:UDP-N-acetylmuramoyl-tripeptide--D-alanyl-D-alanine ligase|nr:UDP-N-acetylmuramoyl-tripeptide--D-alanyl-D-alanine ligase [Propionibacteriaceae bacterium]
MLTTVLTILGIVAVVVAGSRAFLYAMHMFQLNSYRETVHLDWMRSHPRSFWSQTLVALLVIATLLSQANAWRIIAIVVLVGCFFLNRRAKHIKKPLVFTGRVQRMMVTTLVIAALLIGLAFVTPGRFTFPIILLVYVLSSVLPVLANLINRPVEAGIRRHYIHDAVKKLKEHPNLIVIGITGSYGKTSVKYMLTTLLKAKYNVLMTPESFNTPMGVVKTIREQLRSTHEIFVCEMGAYRKGEIKEICDIVNPRHGVITAVGEQHLETFKTIDTIRATKYELAEAVAGRGILFLNGDSPQIRQHLPTQERRVYGLSEGVDVRSLDISVSREGTQFSLTSQGKRYDKLQTSLIGEHNVVNLTGAIAVCDALGLTETQIRSQLRKVQGAPHRLQLTQSRGLTIVDDSYNSNPAGARAALATLKLFDDYKICITPGMVDLGSQQDALNEEFGREMADVCDRVILVGRRQTAAIAKGLTTAGYSDADVDIVESFTEAMARAQAAAAGRPAVLLLENDLPDNY